jgi:osmotically-inducible protein OsmY
MEKTMKIPSRRMLLVTSIALSSLAFNSGAEDKLSDDMKEARQEAQIWTTFALSPYLPADDIKISVNNGKATLSGYVSDEAHKELAGEIAKSVDDIKDVDNQLVIREMENSREEAKKRSYGDVVNDTTVTALVKSKLLWSKYAEGLKTEVETHNGRVTLKGKADSGTAREMAGLLAKSTDGVSSVDNQIVVENNKSDMKTESKASSNSVGQGISDSWITTKVKYTLLYSRNVGGSDISVNTENGVVSLSGETSTGSERALAIQLAENISGVKSVNAKTLLVE